MSKSIIEKHREVKISEDVLDEMQIRFFKIAVDEKICDAFLIRKNGAFHSYVNECRHLPVPLDMYAASVFNSNKNYLQCHQHGALYEIESGLCIEGPCQGSHLKKLQVEKRGKHLVIFFKETKE